MQELIFAARFLVIIPFAICCIYLLIKRIYRTLFVLILGVLVVNILSEAFKLLIPIQRPFITEGVPNPIWTLSDGSFFSGHTASLFVLGAIMWRVNKSLSWLAFLVGVIVGCLRVYIGVHYALDVVAGALMGLITGTILKSGLSRFKDCPG